MNDSQDKINQTRLGLAETEAQKGKNSLEVSYKLDELADLLKEDGHLLDAANTSARAKSIRAAHFALEANKQQEKIGDISKPGERTAVGWLKILHKSATIGCAVLLIFTIFMSKQSMQNFIAREIFGGLLAGALVQLLLFPIKSIPRWAKYVIVAISSALIWGAIGSIG